MTSTQSECFNYLKNNKPYNQVSVTKMWMWRSLDKSPDKREPWRIRLEGEPGDIESVNRAIQKAIKNVNFHRLKFRIIGEGTDYECFLDSVFYLLLDIFEFFTSIN